MKNKMCRIIASLLCFFLLLSAAPLSELAGLDWPELHLPKLSSLFVTKATAADPTSGTCGENLTWNYDISLQTLTINGTGNMKEYGHDYISYTGPSGSASYAITAAPWRPFFEEMKVLSIQDGVTSISKYAFTLCVGLLNITIPDSVKSIGDSAFTFCSGLSEIFVPNSVTQIGTYVFYGCSGLESVTISDRLTEIGYATFLNCSSLSEIIIPNGITRIGEKAFADCVSLTSISIPESVTSIGRSAFARCARLINVQIPNGMKSIEDESFFGCSKLRSIYLPESMESIGDSVFSNCSELASINISTENPVYRSANNCLIDTKNKVLIQGCRSSVIPNDGSVTIINNSAFYGCPGLKNIIIPEQITTIGNSAFSGCTGLTSIIIPNGVTSIGDSGFYNCSRLKNIIFQGDLNSIGRWAFYGCREIESISIPNGLTGIGDKTFYGCERLTSITLPNSIKTIGESAFYSCTSLTNITIPQGVTTIGKSAFSLCGSLTSIELPDSVMSIGESAFYGCHDLRSVTIPKNIVYINNYVFCSCRSLKSVSIPESVVRIGDSAFLYCSSLSNIFYQGTEEQWQSILIGNNNDALFHSSILCLGDMVFNAVFYVNNEVYQTYSLYPGNAIPIPDSPVIEGRRFLGWSPSVPAVMSTENLEFQAIFDHYTATFLVDGKVYKTEEFTAMQESIYEPDVPEKPGYTGAWAPYILNEQDLTIEAIYTPIEYTATFIADGKTVKEIPFTVETVIFALPSVPEKEGHAGKWESFAFNYEDLTIHAVYTPNTYTATVIADGETIAEIPFTYGQKSIQLPEVPKKEGYTGVWPPYSLGASDLTIEAVYTPIEYTVTYYADDQVIGSGAIPYGNSVWQPRTPQKEGFTFSGWTPKVPETMPAEDLTFIAVFEPNPYTVTWIVDGAEFKTETILFGDPITAPTPDKEGYTFSGWKEEIPTTMPAQALTFRGSFTLNQYTLRLISDGAELVNTKVAHGTFFQLLTAPTKTGYTLLGWSTDPTAASAAYAVGGTYSFTADTTLYAVWQKNADPEKPLVTIQGFESTKNVAYKTTVTFTADLSNAPEGTAAHWIIDGKDVHTGETYSVKQATKDYTVQVKLIGADGTELYASEVETVKVKVDFFSRLIAFFRQIFGALPIITQAIEETL